MKRLGRLALAAALLVPAGIAVSTGAGAVGPSATCSGGLAGTVGIAPGLKLVARQSQALSIANATQSVCSGGYVTAGVVKTQALFPLKTAAVNCQNLLNGIATKTPLWSGRIQATWTAPPGMGKTVAAISAYVTSSVGTSTSFHFSGNVIPGGNLFTHGHVSGNFTIDKGLNSTAATPAGSCSLLNPITGANITASSLKITTP